MQWVYFACKSLSHLCFILCSPELYLAEPHVGTLACLLCCIRAVTNFDEFLKEIGLYAGLS